MAGMSKKLQAHLSGPDAQLKQAVHGAVKDAAKDAQTRQRGNRQGAGRHRAGCTPTYQGHDRR